jgi:hypothetical protein
MSGAAAAAKLRLHVPSPLHAANWSSADRHPAEPQQSPKAAVHWLARHCPHGVELPPKSHSPCFALPRNNPQLADTRNGSGPRTLAQPLRDANTRLGVLHDGCPRKAPNAFHG